MFHIKLVDANQPIFQRHSEHLLTSGRFSDLIINCGIQEFKVHKSQLSLACPSVELLNVEKIRLSEFDPEVIWTFLEFIYAGESKCPIEYLTSLKRLSKAFGCWSLLRHSLVGNQICLDQDGETEGDEKFSKGEIPLSIEYLTKDGSPVTSLLNKFQPIVKDEKINLKTEQEFPENKEEEDDTFDTSLLASTQFDLSMDDDFENDPDFEEALDAGDDEMTDPDFKGSKNFEQAIKKKIKEDAKLVPKTEEQEVEEHIAKVIKKKKRKRKSVISAPKPRKRSGPKLDNPYRILASVEIDGKNIPKDQLGFKCPYCVGSTNSMHRTLKSRSSMKLHLEKFHQEKLDEALPILEKLPIKAYRTTLKTKDHPWLCVYDISWKVESKFPCNYCSQMYGQKDTLKKHCQKLHPDEDLTFIQGLEDRPYKCDKCEYAATSTTYLAYHIQDKHADGESGETYNCKMCDSTFDCHRRLTIHIKEVHERKSSWVCAVCAKHYASRANYKDHMKTHSGIRDIHCEYCDATFSRTDVMKKHVQIIHLQIRDKICQTCGKGFATNSILKQHVKTVHLGIKDKKCQHCDAAFSCTANLKKHLMHSHGYGELFKSKADIIE